MTNSGRVLPKKASTARAMIRNGMLAWKSISIRISRLDPAAEMRGDEAHGGAEGRGDHGAEEGDQQADADRHDEPREHVAAELVAAQRMAHVPPMNDRRHAGGRAGPGR